MSRSSDTPWWMGLISLWIATLAFSSASSILAKLGQLGTDHLVGGRNPISFCNVLFAASVVAGLSLFAIHFRSWRTTVLRGLRVRDWALLIAQAFFIGVLAPSLFFFSLMLTEVINVVLISTLKIPLTLLLGWWLFRERPTKGTFWGALIALIGIVLIILLQDPTKAGLAKPVVIGTGTGPLARLFAWLPRAGEICATLAIIIKVVSVEMCRKQLARIPVGVFSVFRMVVGAIIFFVIAVMLFGFGHFADLGSPFLWRWMFLYGGVVVGGGLFFWYRGLQSVNSSDLAVANAFAPLAGIGFAYFILGEVPNQGQIIGGSLIVLGIAIALFDKLRSERAKRVELTHRTKPNSFFGF